MSQTPHVWYHLYLRGYYHSHEIRDGFPEAEWLSRPSRPLCSSVPSDLSVWTSLCRFAWGLCKYTLTLGGMESQRDFPWLAPVNGALLDKQMHCPPPCYSCLGSVGRKLKVLFSNHLYCCCNPQFLSQHYWVSIWCGCLLWWGFLPTDVIWTKATGTN